MEDTQDQIDEDQNYFVLEELPSTSVFLEKSFSDLNADQKKRFFSYEVCVRLLYTENVREVEDVFKRLNKFTLPLKPQELGMQLTKVPSTLLARADEVIE